MQKTISIELGYYGHQAELFQELFKEYSKEPNQYGTFLEFANITDRAVNMGVIAYTNAFENETHFNQVLMRKLKWFFIGEKIKSSELYKQII